MTLATLRKESKNHDPCPERLILSSKLIRHMSAYHKERLSDCRSTEVRVVGVRFKRRRHSGREIRDWLESQICQISRRPNELLDTAALDSGPTPNTARHSHGLPIITKGIPDVSLGLSKGRCCHVRLIDIENRETGCGGTRHWTYLDNDLDEPKLIEEVVTRRRVNESSV